MDYWLLAGQRPPISPSQCWYFLHGCACLNCKCSLALAEVEASVWGKQIEGASRIESLHSNIRLTRRENSSPSNDIECRCYLLKRNKKKGLKTKMKRDYSPDPEGLDQTVRGKVNVQKVWKAPHWNESGEARVALAVRDWWCSVRFRQKF